jgi:two-component system, OmpR family, sensor histidine kinase BaeS
MKISIGHRLFISVLLAIVLVAASAVALMRQNVVDSFGDYALQIELDRLAQLSDSLAERYAATGNWEFVPAANRPRWIAEELARLQQRRTVSAVAPGAPVAPAAPRKSVPAPVAAPAPPMPPEPPVPPLPPLPPPQVPVTPPAPMADAVAGTLGLQDRVTLFDAAGRYLAGRPPGPEPRAERPIRVGDRTVGLLAVARGARPSDAMADAFYTQVRSSLWLIAAACIALSALAAVLLAAHFRKPILRLADGARALEEGRYDTRLPDERSDELGELARSFNQLAHKLASAEQARRQWVADTSHELRTPLSVLRAQLEAIEDGVRPASADSVASMLRQVLALNKLIDELYALARADVGEAAYQRQHLDLWQLAAQQAQAFEQRFAAAGLLLETGAAPSPALVSADPDRLRQVFANVFENCIRYGGNGRVSLHGSSDGAALAVTVDDSGPGVPDAALARLAERFYRVEASRDRAHGGAGLGLALCQRIVEGHGGSLVFARSPLGGLRVTVTLPLAAA